MDTIGTRIREIRKIEKLTLEAFGQRIQVSNAAVSSLESGRNNPSNQTIHMICSEFGVNEIWLRSGDGEPYAAVDRSKEMANLVKTLLSDSPDSFRSRLVTALLRFDPGGSEWELLEKIYNSIAAEADAKKEEDDH